MKPKALVTCKTTLLIMVPPSCNLNDILAWLPVRTKGLDQARLDNLVQSLQEVESKTENRQNFQRLVGLQENPYSSPQSARRFCVNGSKSVGRKRSRNKACIGEQIDQPPNQLTESLTLVISDDTKGIQRLLQKAVDTPIAIEVSELEDIGFVTSLKATDIIDLELEETEKQQEEHRRLTVSLNDANFQVACQCRRRSGS